MALREESLGSATLVLAIYVRVQGQFRFSAPATVNRVSSGGHSRTTTRPKDALRKTIADSTGQSGMELTHPAHIYIVPPNQP